MRIPLSIKISLGVILVVLLQTTLVLYNAYAYLLNKEVEETKNEVHINNSRLQQTIEFLVQISEYEQIQSELSSIGSNRHVRNAFVVDESNNVLASSKISQVGYNTRYIFGEEVNSVILPLFSESRFKLKSKIWLSEDRKNLYSSYPIVLGLKKSEDLLENRVGIIYSHVDLSWVDIQVKQALKVKIVPMLFILGIMAFLFSLYLNRYITKRISNIHEAANNFTTSGYEARALVSGSDELSDLANSFNDMAEKVAQQNDELVKKEEKISLVLNSMEEGVITIYENGIIQSFNKSAENLFGYLEKDVLGENVNIIMPEPYRSQHDEILKSYLRTGKGSIIGRGRDVPALHKNGHVFTMSLSVSELPGSIQGRRIFIGSCRDVTLMKEQEQKLRHSQKMDALGKLTGGIAHDYNNMLGVIIGYAELLIDRLTDSPKLLKYANEIHYAGTRGAKLTKKLLSFSRKKSSESSVTNLNTLLNDNNNMLEKTLTARIELSLDLEHELWPVYLDFNDFEDALLNMCINAMHAMPDGGKLSLSTHNIHLNIKEAEALKLSAGQGDYVHLSICDTGTGIENEVLNKIFDPFFSTKEEKGNGLGLSQVYGFVARSNGAIKVDSVVNDGTCFNLYFPRHMDESIDRQNSDVYTLTKGEDETILIVDDEPSLRELLEEILQTHGYKVLAAENGNAALEILKHKQVDLIISDVIMPGMDGYELSQKVRDKYPQVKIQLASGFSDDRHIKNDKYELHSSILNKPFDRQQLLFRVHELLSNDENT